LTSFLFPIGLIYQHNFSPEAANNSNWDSIYVMDNRLLEGLDKRFDKVIVKIEDEIHHKMRSEIREKIKMEYEKEKRTYQRRRFNVEGYIGNIKNKYGSNEEAKIYESAKSLILGKILIYSLIQYTKIAGTGAEAGYFIFYYFY